MLQSDVSALDELLAADIIFTNHLGQLMSKQDDLEAHRSGTLKIHDIKLSNRLINIHDGIAVVSVQSHILGEFAGNLSESDFRFTRVWNQSADGVWQIIAGHSSVIT